MPTAWSSVMGEPKVSLTATRMASAHRSLRWVNSFDALSATVRARASIRAVSEKGAFMVFTTDCGRHRQARGGSTKGRRLVPAAGLSGSSGWSQEERTLGNVHPARGTGGDDPPRSGATPCIIVPTARLRRGRPRPSRRRCRRGSARRFYSRAFGPRPRRCGCGCI